MDIVAELRENRDLPSDKLAFLIETCDEDIDFDLKKNADEVRRQYYGKKVYLRGLVEISNHCKNNCLYCGIRRSNIKCDRYRLTPDEILNCCKEGYYLGFRTFVLQGGEDPYYTDQVMCHIVSSIKTSYPDCAVTLSLGERSYESYKMLREAGADRYLMRHEAADPKLYGMLHPSEMSLENRKKCLYTLKKLGYQVGSGFMVGAPFQTVHHLVSDIRLLQDINPEMIGIGPFVPHSETPFSEAKGGTLALTLRVLAILRLMFPKALIPATTALGTIAENGRELGLQSGCNVVMPNLSPVKVRKKYELYNNKICTGEEAAECRQCLQKRIESVGYEVEVSRGDAIGFTELG